MLRPFKLRDSGLLRRLGSRSIPLHTALLYAHSYAPLRGAILHRLLRRNYPTYVWRSRGYDVEAFIQCRLNEERTHAHVLWLGASHAGGFLRRQSSSVDSISEAAWLAMMEQFTYALGEQGIQSIVVEVREDMPVCDYLRMAGFAVYTRQDIWVVDDDKHAQSPTPNTVSQRQRVHDWDIEKLYAHIVPNMIRMVEPHPPYNRDSWVRYEGHDLVAYAAVEAENNAMWLHLLVSLMADTDPARIIGSVLRRKPPSKQLPLICRVRNYQEWLNRPLEKNGFTHLGSQVVMVKHTVQHVKKPLHSLEQVLQTNGATARPSPIIQKIHSFENPQLVEQVD